ncbi:hypothetical protein KAH55_14460, partial [bacterium]|nr:hypothetical protein [bacterium]
LKIMPRGITYPPRAGRGYAMHKGIALREILMAGDGNTVPNAFAVETRHALSLRLTASCHRYCHVERSQDMA